MNRLVEHLLTTDAGTFSVFGEQIDPQGYVVGGATYGLVLDIEQQNDLHFCTMAIMDWLETMGNTEFVGVWTEKGVKYIDACNIFGNYDEAYAIAKARGEQAFYDGIKGEVVYVT